MADHQRYNKVRKKLNGRNFCTKSLFDMHGEKIEFNPDTEGVYLQSEVDEVLENFKKLFEEFTDEAVVLKKKVEKLETENYYLQKNLKRTESKLIHQKKEVK